MGKLGSVWESAASTDSLADQIPLGWGVSCSSHPLETSQMPKGVSVVECESKPAPEVHLVAWIPPPRCHRCRGAHARASQEMMPARPQRT